MATILYTHKAGLDHDTGMGHPERPARLAAVWKALDDPGFSALDRREAPRATDQQILAMHPSSHLEMIREASPAKGMIMLDADTVMSPGSLEAAERAAGAVCAAVDVVLDGEADNAFCAVRPPGHHAEPTRPMGFCLFNSVAIGAAHAQAAHGLERVAVMDFDVHHGNGTQAMFWDRPSLFYASTHQMPLYPGTGAADERGASNNIVNAPLPPGAGGTEFRNAMEGIILPALRRFSPELLLISAGFDAHRADPLAGLNFDVSDFVWATEVLVSVADECCEGRVVSTLEGGYDLQALAESAAAHVRALMAAG